MGIGLFEVVCSFVKVFIVKHYMKDVKVVFLLTAYKLVVWLHVLHCICCHCYADYSSTVAEMLQGHFAQLE